MNKKFKNLIVSSFLLTGILSFSAEVENLSTPTEVVLELVKK